MHYVHSGFTSHFRQLLGFTACDSKQKAEDVKKLHKNVKTLIKFRMQKRDNVLEKNKKNMKDV